MAKEIKFTDEEVSQINQLRNDVSSIFTQLGQLSIEKKRRIDEVESLENELLEKHSKLTETEQELFKTLNDKYGDGNYDPSTNTFIPVEKTEEVVIENEK